MRGVTGAARPRSSRQPGVRAFFVQGKVSIVRIRRSTPRANVRMAVVGVSRYAALIAPSRSVTKVTGGVGGKLVAGVFEGSTEELVIPLAVLGDDQADRALRVFELRDGVEEGAAAEGGLEDPGGDVVTDSADKVAPLHVSACSVARAAHMVVRTVQVGDDQVDLAGEVPVERRERDLALLDDPLDPHAVDALGVEQQRRGGQ
jgi:hypothetical protein